MPRIYRIKWRTQDIQLLRRVVKNFNAKISRLVKKTPDIEEFLPQKLSVKELRKSIETRKDFNKIISSAKRFSIKEAEKLVQSDSGIITTKWQLEETKRNIQQINLARAKRLKQINPSPTKGTMGTIEEAELKPKQFNFDKIKTKDWDAFVRSAFQQSLQMRIVKKNNLYLQNYLKGVDNNYGKEGVLIKILAQRAGADKLAFLHGQDYRLQLKYQYTEAERMYLIANTLTAFYEHGVYLTPDEIKQNSLLVSKLYEYNENISSTPYDNFNDFMENDYD